MVFSDTTTKLGIIQQCERTLFGHQGYGRISGNDDLLYEFTERINRAQDRFAHLAITSDGRWQFDDDNYTTFPIYTIDLNSGQQDYGLAVTFLEIEKVLIKDAGGSWALLRQSHDVSDTFGNDASIQTILENNSSNTGQPTSYDKIGPSLVFDKTPGYSQSGGIKLYVKRGPSYFVYTDTTKVPGFASIFHDFLGKHASANFAMERGMQNAKNLMELVMQEEQAIQGFYSVRSKDEKSRMKPLIENSR